MASTTSLTPAALRLRHRGSGAGAVVRNADRARISDTIVAEAEPLGACLIIVGAKSRTKLSAARFGNTASRVVRKAHTPVMLVKLSRRPPRPSY